MEKGIQDNSIMDEDIGIIKKRDKKSIATSRIKRRILKHVWLIRILLVVGVVALLFLIVFIFSFLFKGTDTGRVLTLGKNFIFTPTGVLDSIGGRTNILILGKGGTGHEAPDLTDTIIFFSISPDTKKIVSVSIPRDIWIPELRAKVNSAYYWGNQKQPASSQGESGGGLVLARSSVEKIVGQPISYTVVFDFSAFKEIIDVIGGIEVDVENSFVDPKFPIPGREDDECDGDPEFKCRYETLSFSSGKQNIDGETALKFVRSRNAEGDEGTDLARDTRQQKVILAIQEKIFSREVILSPKKILALQEIVRKYVETNIIPEEASILARYFFDARNNISNHVLSEDFLINPPTSSKYDNLYVFIPKVEGWSEVNKWIEKLLH